MQVEIKGENLVITLPLIKNGGRPSKSGDTQVFATTGGNQPTELRAPDGKKLYVGVNAYSRKKEEKIS